MNIYVVVILYLCKKKPIMRTIEFNSKLSKNRIHIPKEIQLELKEADEKNIRVMIFLDDADDIDDKDDLIFKQEAMEQFLKGYSDSDSIYDNY